jgi:peptidoglycan/LPS O-acetylase OafA/YrhL
MTLPATPTAQTHRDADDSLKTGANHVAPTSDLQRRKAVHIPALDGLRGIAILLVVVFHFSQPAYSQTASGLRLAIQRLTGAGWVGVDLFFVLSGFLITSILYEAKQSDGYFKNFYMRRVLRIFPLYYGVLFVAFAVVPLFHTYQTGFYKTISHHQIYLWTYLQNYVQLPWEGWAGFTHFWSLAVEEQFYLVWPAVVFLLNRRALMGVSIGVVVTALLLRTFVVLDHQSAYAWTPCRMDGLAIGAFLALASHGHRGIVWLARPAVFVGAVAAVLLVLVAARNHGSFWYGDRRVQTIGYSLLALLFGAALVRAVVATPGSLWGGLLNSRWLRFFGKYSYGLYVFHGLLMWWVKDGLLLSGLVRGLHSFYLGLLAHLLVLTVASTAVALLSWHLYEKHFLKLKRFFEYRATTLREPVRDAVVPPIATASVEITPTAEPPAGQPIVG